MHKVLKGMYIKCITCFMVISLLMFSILWCNAESTNAAPRSINIERIIAYTEKVTACQLKYSGRAYMYDDAAPTHYFELQVYLKRKQGTSWITVDNFTSTFPVGQSIASDNKTVTVYSNGTYMTTVTVNLYKRGQTTNPEIGYGESSTVVVNYW